MASQSQPETQDSLLSEMNKTDSNFVMYVLVVAHESGCSLADRRVGYSVQRVVVYAVSAQFWANRPKH